MWSAAPELVLDDPPLVSAGAEPLVTERIEDTRRIYRLDLDPTRSSLQRSPDWPILLANLAEMRRTELPGPERTNLALGEAFVYRPSGSRRSAETTVYELRDPNGETTRHEARRSLVLEGLQRTGLYRLSSEGRALCDFAMSFQDAAESDLSGAASGAIPSERGLAQAQAELGPLESTGLALVLLALLADWWVLQRSRRRFRAHYEAGATREDGP